MGERKPKCQAVITDEQEEKIRTLAFVRKVTVGGIIRVAIDSYLAAHPIRVIIEEGRSGNASTK